MLHKLKYSKRLLYGFLILIQLGGTLSHASEKDTLLHLQMSEKNKNGQFLIGTEFSQVTANSSQLMGAGFRFGYEYGLSEHWSVLPAIALEFQVGKSQGYLYSGIEASFRYSIFGSLMRNEVEVSNHDQVVILQKDRRENRLALIAGFEQLFLNGTQSVYPAAGFSAGGAYDCFILQHFIEFSVRDAMMISGKKNTSTVFIDISFLLDSL